MPLHVALLRAVNLPNHGSVSMADLRALFRDLGFADVQTQLQSGNVVFDPGSRAADVEALLEGEAAKRLGLKTDFMVRTAGDLAALVRDNPFAEAARDNPSGLVAMFLKDAVEPASVERLQTQVKGREEVRAHGRELYITYPDGIGRSKLTNAFIESRLGTRVTGRNWNTVLKLATLTGAG